MKIYTLRHSDWGIPNHEFWMHQPLLQVLKNVNFPVCFLHTRIRNVIRGQVGSLQRMTYQIIFFKLKYAVVQAVRACIIVVKSDPVYWFFEKQQENEWLCTAQNRMFFVVSLVLLRQFQFFLWKSWDQWSLLFHKKHWFKVLCALTTAVGFDSSWNNLEPTTVHFRAHSRECTTENITENCYNTKKMICEPTVFEVRLFCLL